MNGAHFASETRAKSRKDSRGLQDDTTEALHEFRIVIVMRFVLLQRDRVRDLHGHRPDAHGRSNSVERAHHLLVERSNGHRLESECLPCALAGFGYKLMFDEVEIDLQHAGAMRHWCG